MPLYLGIAGSAQALAAVVIETGRRRRIVFDRAIELAHGDSATPVIADALDRLMGRLAAAAEIDIDDLRGIGGAATDDVGELRERIASLPHELDPSRPLAAQLTTLPSAGERPSHHGTDRLGYLSAYWHRRYALPPAPVLDWSNEAVARAAGSGVVRRGMIAIGFGPADVVITGPPTPAAVSFRNGQLARQWVCDQYGLDGNAVAAILDSSQGNDGYVMLPWLEPEITPRVMHAGIRRFAFDRFDAARNVRGLIEGQVMAMANHAARIMSDPIERVVATGADARSHAILQVVANVFGAEVYRSDTRSPVALGAALRAYHRERTDDASPDAWSETVSGFIDSNPAFRVWPNPRHVATYAALRREYAILERLHQHRRPIC